MNDEKKSNILSTNKEKIENNIQETSNSTSRDKKERNSEKSSRSASRDRKKKNKNNFKKKKSRSISKDKKAGKSSRSISKDKKSEKSSNSNSREKKEKKEVEEDDKEDLSLDNNYQNNNLYALLGLQKTATSSEIRKAYRRLVFLIHPDKNKNDPDASSKFANINRAYKILSNEQSRKYYDETGEYDEENEGQINISETLNFFRKIYSPQDIENYENKYIGSKEEEQDLICFYTENNGDIRKILECIPCSKNEDVQRFIKIYEDLFRKKILKKNKNYEESKNKIKLLKEDQKEKEEAKETLDKLTKQIILNKKKRNYNDYLDGLAKKYGGEEEEYNEINEEEFQKIANRLNKGKKQKNKKK